MDCYYVFIVAGKPHNGLRIGLTRDLPRRLERLPSELPDLPASDARLVYYEVSHDADAACRRERQLRRWSRERRARLVATMNPQWDDLRSKW